MLALAAGTQGCTFLIIISNGDWLPTLFFPSHKSKLAELELGMDLSRPSRCCRESGKASFSHHPPGPQWRPVVRKYMQLPIQCSFLIGPAHGINVFSVLKAQRSVRYTLVQSGLIVFDATIL